MTNIEGHVIHDAEQHMAAISVARASSASVALDALNAENRKLRDELTVATVAAQAASQYYWLEWAGEKTYLSPAQVKDRFANAMVEYREATGADKVDLVPGSREHVEHYGSPNRGTNGDFPG